MCKPFANVNDTMIVLVPKHTTQKWITMDEHKLNPKRYTTMGDINTIL
jgi:hypothetical protein